MLWLHAALLLLCSATAQESPAATASPPASTADFWGVGAFYYVWYGDPQTDGAYMHWNHSILPHWNEHVQAKHAGELHACCSIKS